MKKANYIIGFLMVALVGCLASCEDEIVRESTHTDASGKVVGTYSGTLSYDTVSFSDVTVVFTQIESDSVQAASFTIESPSFNFAGSNGLDLSGMVNVATANDGYSMSSAQSLTSKLTGRLNNTDLYMKLPIQVTNSNKEVRFHPNGFNWEFIGTKN